MSQEVCDVHDDCIVVFESRSNVRQRCPFCELAAKVDDLLDQIKELKDGQGQ